MAIQRREWSRIMFQLRQVTRSSENRRCWYCWSSSLLRPSVKVTTNPIRNVSDQSKNEEKALVESKQPKTTSSTFMKIIKNINIVERTIAKMAPRTAMEKARLLRGAARTYEQLSDEVDVKEFFEDFAMPDTFASWFTVMELHTYVLSARLLKHEKYGMHARDMLTDSFWNEVVFRSRKLGPKASLHRAKQLATLAYQLQAAFYGYDEGVQTNDMVLAAVVWRRFFGFECDDAEKIERVVKYIRVQLDYLGTLSFEDIVFNKKILTIPLKEVLIG